MAKKTFLDFEQPVAELEAKIEELRYVQTESAVDITLEIEQLSKKSQQLTKDIYSDLSPWQVTKISRHPERPYTLDYINGISRNYFSGEPVSRSDAREVAQAWSPYATVATWYIWRSLDPVPVAY